MLQTSSQLQVLAFKAFNGRRMKDITLHKGEHGENEMINQKLVVRSFFYILKICYQTARNSSSLGTRRTA